MIFLFLKPGEKREYILSLETPPKKTKKNKQIKRNSNLKLPDEIIIRMLLDSKREMMKLLDINIQVLIYANTKKMLLMQVEYDRKTLKNIMIQIAIIS